MDIFGDDIDSYMENNGLNENIRPESDVEEVEGNVEPNENEDENAEKDENGEPIKVEPKKRSVRKPQLRLNVDRLKSNRGIHTVEEFCADLKFSGKGYERHDLNNLMKRLHHWGHRLYPNYKFDDLVAQIEKLGKKKQIQTHMYRYRQGVLEDVVKNTENIENDPNEENESQMGVEPIDELDEIIDQQIQNYTIPPRTPAHDRTFDSVRSSMIASPRFYEQNPIASTPVVRPTVHEREESVVEPAAPTLTSEQMARIAENRRLAQERLKQKKMQEAAQAAQAAQPSTSTDNYSEI